MKADLTHVTQKARADRQRRVSATLQILQKILSVKVTQLLHIPKNNTALPSQILRHIQTLHLRKIMFHDVSERADVLSLCRNHLIHDVLDFTENHR